MSKLTVHDTPSDVSTDVGKVIVDGPDSVAVSLTPEAAVETADRLLVAAAEAHGKALISERREDLDSQTNAP